MKRQPAWPAAQPSRLSAQMSCEECRELVTHTFRTAEDLIYAIRLASQEVDRGVLVRVATRGLSPNEQEALDSSLASGALPTGVSYRFRCAVCGDRFALEADTSSGMGSWTRESEPAGN
jgi:hypothetical protein